MTNFIRLNQWNEYNKNWCFRVFNTCVEIIPRQYAWMKNCFRFLHIYFPSKPFKQTHAWIEKISTKINFTFRINVLENWAFFSFLLMKDEWIVRRSERSIFIDPKYMILLEMPLNTYKIVIFAHAEHCDHWPPITNEFLKKGTNKN